jgi:hypothetical protein
MATQHQKKRIYDAPATGLSAVTLASERTSSPLSCDGYRNLTVYFNFTAQSAATALICKVEVSHDGGSTWGQIKSESISSGTGTLSDYSQSFATTSASLVPFRFTLDDDHFRVKISATGGAAGDVCSVTCRLSNGE